MTLPEMSGSPARRWSWSTPRHRVETPMRFLSKARRQSQPTSGDITVTQQRLGEDGKTTIESGCEIDGSKASRLKKTNVTDNLDDDVTRLYMENLEMNGNEETARRKPTAVLSFIDTGKIHAYGARPMDIEGNPPSASLSTREENLCDILCSEIAFLERKLQRSQEYHKCGESSPRVAIGDVSPSGSASPPGAATPSSIGGWSLEDVSRRCDALEGEMQEIKARLPTQGSTSGRGTLEKAVETASFNDGRVANKIRLLEEELHRIRGEAEKWKAAYYRLKEEQQELIEASYEDEKTLRKLSEQVCRLQEQLSRREERSLSASKYRIKETLELAHPHRYSSLASSRITYSGLKQRRSSSPR